MSGLTRWRSGAERRGDDAADQQADGRRGEGLPAHGQDEGRRIVTVRKNSAVLTVPMVLRGLLPWTSRLEVTIAPQPPPPAASRNPPTARGLDDPRPLLGVPVHDAAVEKIEAERRSDRSGRPAWRGQPAFGQHIGAEHAADDAGDDDPRNSRQSTLRWATWLIAETPVVKVSAVWTLAEAQGGTPRRSAGCWRSARKPCPARRRSAARRSRRG